MSGTKICAECTIGVYTEEELQQEVGQTRMTTAARLKLMRRVTRWSMIAVVGLSLYHIPQVDCVPSASVNESLKCTESEVVRQRTDPYDHVECSVQPTFEEPIPVVPEIVEQVVAAESRGESLEGQMAVVQTIMETANYYNLSYEEVAMSSKYTDPVPYDLVTDSVREACYRVIYLGEKAVDEPIMWFYSTRGGFYSSWHETSKTIEYVTTIGNHKFYKLRGSEG